MVRGDWPNLRRIRIEELDEKTRALIPSVKQRFSTNVPSLRVHVNSGLFGVDLSEAARKVLWYLRVGISPEDFIERANDDGLNGEAVWNEIMSHNPNLELTNGGEIRFKREIWVFGIPNFNWREELSPPAQELYQLVAAGKYTEKELRQLAREKDIDFEVTFEELKSYDGLYSIGPFGFVTLEARIVDE